jgi:hypothetical protein
MIVSFPIHIRQCRFLFSSLLILWTFHSASIFLRIINIKNKYDHNYIHNSNLNIRNNLQVLKAKSMNATTACTDLEQQRLTVTVSEESESVSSSRLDAINRSRFTQLKDRICPINTSNKKRTAASTTTTNTATATANDNDDDESAVFLEGYGGHQILQMIRRQHYQTTQQRNNVNNTENTDGTNITNNTKKSSKKILCMVYIVFDETTTHSNVEAQAMTWGRQCDGWVAFSNMTQHNVGAIRIEHDGVESYNNMWQKIRSMWYHIYTHYLDEYDYFHICGDDVYLYIPNMRLYLNSQEIEELESGQRVDIITKKKKQQQQEQQQRPTSSMPLLLGIPMGFNRDFFLQADQDIH